ncbi:hypothetical protein [Chitinophaga nivalis]|uniref:DUF4843 domain-containing protein n=1 Tax=Chitinophaga nivalis TaxID=2991709 RepID=A0ABT3IGB4_9BACT|nr:hypothetical protein [Chitinophaga nivalis]MCW3467327.1 hypothetical protein [Chitinophaga nivalis]MCW3482981.1 hypothetical protein [Chitinophaga nivalis]
MKYWLIAGCLSLLMTACKKNNGDEVMPAAVVPKTVVDYVLCNEGMYLVKYKPVYNRYYQVISLLRGEQFAPESQLQPVATFYYSDQREESIPDSVQVYNVRRKVAGVIKGDYNVVVHTKKDTTYNYPERRNRFLETTGGRTLMLIANKEVDWGGSGHLGGNNSIKLMSYLPYFNKPTLQDMITGKTDYGNVTGLQLQFTAAGYPIRVDYTDNYNAAYTHMIVAYRQP